MSFSKGHIHRIAFLATVLLSLLAFLPSAFAGISVRGNRRVDSETIRSYFAGTSPDEINKGVKDLYATGLFSDVKVGGGGGNVVITVNENRAVNRVVFEGASKVKPEQLETELSTKTRGSYSPTLVNADIERIKDVYRRSGRAAPPSPHAPCSFPTAPSTSSSPSTRARRPASNRSTSSATKPIRVASSVT